MFPLNKKTELNDFLLNKGEKYTTKTSLIGRMVWGGARWSEVIGESNFKPRMCQWEKTSVIKILRFRYIVVDSTFQLKSKTKFQTKQWTKHFN